MIINPYINLILLTLRALDLHSSIDNNIIKKHNNLEKIFNKKIELLLLLAFDQKNKSNFLKKVKTYKKIMSSNKYFFEKDFNKNYYSFIQFWKKFNFYSNHGKLRTKAQNFTLALKGLLLVEYLLENYEFKNS